MPGLRATGLNEVWNWDITYLRNMVKIVWLYLYLVVDSKSLEAVAWDVAEREDAAVAAELVSRV